MKTAINDVKLFDGENVLFEKGSVLFDETGFLEIRDTAFSKSEADLRIDGSGKTLAPGLIDGHVHMGCGGLEPDYSFAGYAEDAAVTASQASEVWRYGITTLCDCGNGYESDITVRNMIRAGQMDGCRVLACGKGISITGGHGWPMNHECDDELSVLTAARLQLRNGADFVKLFATGGMATKGSIPNVAQLTEGQMRTAVKAAETVGSFTRAHCTGIEGAQNAIRAGVRIIDHIMMDDETARMMKEHGCFYCPTIVTRYNILNSTDERYAYMRAKADPKDLDRKKRALMLCKAYGITILAGTDSSGRGLTRIGSSMWTELQIYADYALTCLEALRAATKDAAKALGLSGVTGEIRAGLQADLVLFDGDPTTDMKDVETICATFQGGKAVWTSPAALKA